MSVSGISSTAPSYALPNAASANITSPTTATDSASSPTSSPSSQVTLSANQVGILTELASQSSSDAAIIDGLTQTALATDSKTNAVNLLGTMLNAIQSGLEKDTSSGTSQSAATVATSTNGNSAPASATESAPSTDTAATSSPTLSNLTLYNANGELQDTLPGAADLAVQQGIVNTLV